MSLIQIAASLLAALLLVGAPAGESTQPQLPVEGAAAPVVLVDAVDTAVKCVSAEEGELSVEFDPLYYTVERTEVTGGTHFVLGSTDRPKQDAGDIPPITLHIPESYGPLTLSVSDSAVKVEAMNRGIVLRGGDSAVSVTLIESFTKTFSCALEDSAVKIRLPERFENTEVTLKATDSAVRLPREWPAYQWGADYRYLVGDGSAKVSLNVEDSALHVQWVEKETLFS